MAMKKKYMTVDGQIRSEWRSGETQNRDYILDAQGSVVAVYMGTNIVADASYTAFGGDISASWRIDEYRFQWIGGWGYGKSEIDWVNTYVRARHYSAMDGAWTTVDPLWPDERAYQYVQSQTMSLFDYYGLSNCLGHELYCCRKACFNMGFTMEECVRTTVILPDCYVKTTVNCMCKLYDPPVPNVAWELGRLTGSFETCLVGCATVCELTMNMPKHLVMMLPPAIQAVVRFLQLFNGVPDVCAQACCFLCSTIHNAICLPGPKPPGFSECLKGDPGYPDKIHRPQSRWPRG